MIVLKIAIIAILLTIFIQDIKAREVYWFLFPILAISAGVLFYKSVFPQLFFTTTLINLGFVFFLLLVVFLYSKWKLKTTITNTFGLGDVFMFIALCFTFSSISFIVVFVFSLIFALTLHLALKQKSKHKTVPLAGYQGLFFLCIYIGYWSGFINSIYSI